jgi:dipeptidyl aminopeptidase/acylaminoacyl peptidase
VTAYVSNSAASGNGAVAALHHVGRPPRYHVMKLPCQLLLLLVITTGIRSACLGDSPPATLLGARQNFYTKLVPLKAEKYPLEVAPSKIFRTVKYPTANGQLAAYMTPDPVDGKKHPAIIWITGGDCNSIGDVWSAAPRENDQTAAAYREAGIVMMFPSLRGGNDNPGVKEGFLGEVDDIIAAAKYLQTQPYVDSKRIYLGGHSTGGTLALLVSECSPLFRAVFAFGPVEDVAGYGAESGFVPVDLKNRQEVRLRSPGYWLTSVQSPTWVLEGTRGNITSLRAMAKASANAKLRFVEIKGADHFATLAPINEFIARQILQDSGAECSITLSADEVNRHFAKSRTTKQ